jgi:type II secretory pathway predicted ATPase ExeA
MRRAELERTLLRTEPFGDTVNQSFYVPRAATERVLAALIECGREPARPAVLVGPPGVGKSMLLRIAGERLAGPELRVSPVLPAFDAEGLSLWILEDLQSERFDDPLFAFEAYLAHLRAVDSGILLLVDDLYAMPLDAMRWLAHQIANSKGELRLIASAADDPDSTERIALLGPACEVILHDSKMEDDESHAYVRERLLHARAPGITRAVFDASTVSDLHARSGGNPRELNALATKLLATLEGHSKGTSPIARAESEVERAGGSSRLSESFRSAGRFARGALDGLRRPSRRR